MRAFKLGIITDEVSQDMDEIIAFAEVYRLDTLEIRSIFDKPVHMLSDDEVVLIRDRVQAAGMTVCALSAPIFKCDLDNTEELAQHYLIAERCIEVARMLGANMIRGFSFWAKGSFEEQLPVIVEQLRRMAKLLEKGGLAFMLEFDPSVYASNARKTRRLIDMAGVPNLHALYDPGNDLWDPDLEVPYPDGYEHLRGTIAHIHLKDAVTTGEGPIGVAIGRGEVDYPALFQRLVDDGYDGYLILETHYRLTSILTEEQLKRPSGSSFSVGGKEASEECMDALLAMEHFR
ncbi:sugar phosphate isomerase/epimerase family protein [Paenibacillus sp. UNC451MF]|uniref:sugar phosphate isomerase/epimerase family protein n=1 Tax=Paenibacillus sp. UNC451MF TaxID=1449063 RepID=UPI0004918F06|nr:sugar phosphate isomerase/epimerase family protein [Paenibacillus sp. UNC451MF]